jgi:hypothetical protein
MCQLEEVNMDYDFFLLSGPGGPYDPADHKFACTCSECEPQENEMTREQARELLIQAFPQRSVSIQVTDWHYAHGADDEVIYSVAVLPGWDGNCSRESAPTLAEAVAKALAHATAPDPGYSLSDSQAVSDKPF